MRVAHAHSLSDAGAGCKRSRDARPPHAPDHNCGGPCGNITDSSSAVSVRRHGSSADAPAASTATQVAVVPAGGKADAGRYCHSNLSKAQLARTAATLGLPESEATELVDKVWRVPTASGHMAKLRNDPLV